jgi:hypothetical protein
LLIPKKNEHLEHLPGFHHIERGSDTVVLAFSALQAHRTPTYDFYKTFENQIKNTDVIFIRDTENLWYQAGTQGAAGGFKEIIRHLREDIPHYKRVIAMGASMGGYAALAVMPFMPRISTCLAIAPQAFIDEENRAKYGDERWSDRMTIINTALKRTVFYDLKPLYKQSYNGKRPVHILYGEDAYEDKVHAMHMKEFDGVNLIEVKGSDHSVGQTLKERGLLNDIINRAISGDVISLPVTS